MRNNTLIGFDRIFDLLERPVDTLPYPPYNIVKYGDNNYTIELALAGYDEQDINIELKENQLIISADVKTENSSENTSYVFRGIAKRAFTRRFSLSDEIIIDNASFVNGILKIEMHREIPENKKPRKILLNSQKELLTENKKTV